MQVPGAFAPHAVCVCVCVRACVRARVRKRERERASERERERKRERKRETERQHLLATGIREAGAANGGEFEPQFCTRKTEPRPSADLGSS